VGTPGERIRVTPLPAIESVQSLPDAVDVLVIGGGPAGAMAALAAARRGHDTLLVDRVAHPREKVCGCCLAPFGQHALHEAGVSDVLDGSRQVHSVRLSSGSMEVRVRREGTRVLSRSTLDAGVLRHALDAGARLAWPFVATVRDDGETILRGPGGERTIRSRMRVAADGLRGGALADDPRFAWRVRRASRIGVGAIVPADAVDVAEDEIRMQVDACGYVGLVRLADGQVDVAAAIRPEAMRAHHGAGALMRRLLGTTVRDASAIERANWQGTPHLWRERRALQTGDVLVAGDAAGYVEPFTGEGMGWALSTGLAAGEHAAAVIEGTATAPAWEARVRALVGDARARCGWTARALRHPTLVRAALGAAACWPSLAARIATTMGAARVPEGDACRA
jgi:flavin-dependent dehydrogenase